MFCLLDLDIQMFADVALLNVWVLDYIVWTAVFSDMLMKKTISVYLFESVN